MLKRNIELITIKDLITKILNEDIKFEVLGAGKEFSPANIIKNQICEKLISIIDRMEAFSISVPEVFENEILEKLRKHYEIVSKRIESIKKIAEESSLNSQNFPTYRQKQIDIISKDYANALTDFHEFDIQFRILDLEEKNRKFDPQIFNLELQSRLDEIKKAESEANIILKNLKSNAINASVDISENKFRLLFYNHQKLERIWLACSVCLMITLGIFLFSLATTLDDIFLDYIELFLIISHKFLIIAPLSLLLRLTLGKFNIERNLRLIYEHRATIFDQFRIFEAGIGDDKETRAKFLLDLSKNLFADPTTGYLQDKSHDININPIVSIVEKAIKP